jgi:hypothetical protein
MCGSAPGNPPGVRWFPAALHHDRGDRAVKMSLTVVAHAPDSPHRPADLRQADAHGVEARPVPLGNRMLPHAARLSTDGTAQPSREGNPTGTPARKGQTCQAELMTAAGQISRPRAGSFVVVSGQFSRGCRHAPAPDFSGYFSAEPHSAGNDGQGR